MPNHLQAAKRNRQRIKRTERNRHIRQTMRGYVKKVRAMISEGNIEGAREALKIAVRYLDRSVTQGILHRSTASRAISRLTVAVTKIVS